MLPESEKPCGGCLDGHESHYCTNPFGVILLERRASHDVLGTENEMNLRL